MEHFEAFLGGFDLGFFILLGILTGAMALDKFYYKR